MANINNYQQTISTLSEEILGTWDAAEDHGETELTSALYKAEELGCGDLARTIMEGTVEMLFEQLLHNEEGDSMLAIIANYRQDPALFEDKIPRLEYCFPGVS